MLRILMIGPTLDHAGGGIPAVVEGLLKGFSCIKGIQVEYYSYCSSQPGVKLLQRALIALKNMFQILFVIKRSSYVAIHMHTSIRYRGIIRDFLFASIFKILKIPLVLELHGGRLKELKAFHRSIFWVLSKMSARLVLTSKEQINEMLSFYPALQNKVILIPNPVEIPGTLVSRRGIDDTSNQIIKIIFASRLIAEKGGMEFINSLEKINTSKQWIAEMYGDGPERSTIESRIKSLDLSKNVFLRGNVSLENLLKIYSESDIFVFPSTHSEGFPMAFFFALAAGLSIVTSRTSPVPEYLSEPDNCIFIDSKDIQSIAEAITMLISDDVLRKKMEKNNIDLAAVFSPTRVASLFLKLYVKLTEGA